MSNYCYNPTSNPNIRTKSYAKSNSYMCKFTKASASHFLLCKHPSKASKYSPKQQGVKKTTLLHTLKLKVTPLLGWLMRTVSLAYIVCKHCKKCPSTSKPTNTCHNISRGIVSNAFLKSTKQQYSDFFFTLLYFIKVHNMKSWLVVE